MGNVKRGLHNVLRACYTSTISFTEKENLNFSKRVLKIGVEGGGKFYGFTLMKNGAGGCYYVKQLRNLMG